MAKPLSCFYTCFLIIVLDHFIFLKKSNNSRCVDGTLDSITINFSSFIDRYKNIL